APAGQAASVTGGQAASDGAEQRARQTGGVLAERRALLAGILGTLAAGGIAGYIGREGGLAGSSLPLAAPPNPTGQPSATGQPSTTGQPATTGQPTTTADQPTAVTQPQANPTEQPLPNPPPPRRLARDKDGSLTAAGRARGELAPAVTANDDFYVVTKNAVQDPIVDAASWRLVIDGEVNRTVQLDYPPLRGP